jgi:hypothetical protein
MKTLQIALFAGLAATTAGCVEIAVTGATHYIDREERRFTVHGKPELALATFDGSIEVRAWDRPEILVVLERYAARAADAEQIEFVAEQVGDRVTVEARLRRGGEGRDEWGQGRRANLIVSLPASSDVRANSGDGSIEIERISGRVDVRSGDGAIRGRLLTGSVQARTGDGSVWLDRIDGAVEATTGDGSIIANGVLFGVTVQSGDGTITVEAEPGSNTTRPWDLSTGDGSVRVRVPDGFGAQLDAHTGDGRITIRDLTVIAEGARTTRDTLRGRLGDGGGAVRIRTGDGSISVTRR